MNLASYTSWLPEYPRTLHLPHKPNAKRDDLVASYNDVEDIFTSENVYIEEKIDGANSAMMLISRGHDEVPLIRNRSHILSKGYNKATPAKAQFSSIWNWFYENKDKFKALNELLGFEAGVYGEWLYALHGIRYDKLPNLFMPFDIYNPIEGYYLDTGISRKALEDVGFEIIPLLHKGRIQNFEQLEELCEQNSPFASERREGVYIKITDGIKIVKRFKMVRSDFVQGCNWSDKTITRNGLRR
jgi:ATP-dependent RNA circularization protein (DNA/RNA ligase family)